MVQKEDRELTDNKDKCVSYFVILTTLSNICGSVQLPHHNAIHKNREK